MFKTIFSKLIVIFITILLISFSIAGIVLFYFLDSSVSKQKVRALEQGGANILEFLDLYMEYRGNPNADRILKQQIQINSNNTNSFVWVVNKDGYIGPFRTDIPSIIAKNMVQENGLYKLPDSRQFKKVFEGKERVEERGDFYGLFKGTGFSWLVIELPYQYKGDTIGAVYMYTPISEVNKNRNMVIRFFLISVSVSTVVSFILVYIFSLRISRPLKQIRNAAKVIAGGEFEKRLDIRSKDEIGELAVSFNYMASALQNLEEMRRGFIANVSHELRTPMTSIRGFVEGILDGTIPPEKQATYLSIVKDESIRLNRLVNDLLNLARMESGEKQLSLKSFNISELVRRSIIKLENLIVQKNIQVEANFDEEDMQVFADRDAIEQVVINLVHNAVKFTPENGKITISAHTHKDKVHISVEDNGIGIEENELSLIWDRFYKSDKSRGQDKSGTGLGLAIIKSIINEHNEEIWVESRYGSGTKFTFSLKRTEKETENPNDN